MAVDVGALSPARWLAPVRLPPAGQVRPSERLRLIAEILVLYLPAMVAVRRGGPIGEHLAAARCAARRIAVADEDQHELAVRLGVIVDLVLSRLPTDNRCLVRSLVLVRLLARRSIDTRLVIGVGVDGGFRAHAWVEHGGEPLLPVGAYTPLTHL